MKILINGTTLVVGGGLQVGRALIMELVRDSRGHSVEAVVSRNLAELLPGDIRVAAVVSPSPARPVLGIKSRARLREIEKTYRPDVVLTIFGPAYWKPRAIHVCGFANAWIFTDNEHAWRVLSLGQKAVVWGRRLYRRRVLQYEDASALIVETEALVGAIKAKWPGREVFAVPNTCGQAFFERDRKTDGHGELLPFKEEREFRIVTLSQYYPHKNLEIIPEIARFLQDKQPAADFRFYLSLDENSSRWAVIREKARILGIQRHVISVGVVQPQRAPDFYEGADAMLLPSVLECFSANYPEAMKMGVPIVTTDLPFARSVCGDAALYYSPRNAESAAAAIETLYRDISFAQSLVSKGAERIREFPTPREKARRYIEICEALYEKRRRGQTP